MTSSKGSWATRFDEFFFAPVNPVAAAIFRILLAAMTMWVFTNHSRMTWVPQLGTDELYATVFLTQPYRWVTILGLVLVGTGVRPRIVGLFTGIMLLPHVFVVGGQHSRQVILFSFAAFCFVRSDVRFSLLPAAKEKNGSLPDHAGPIWPIRLIQLQVTALYGINALLKSTPEYLSGDILIGFSKMLPNFKMDFTDGVFHLGVIAIPIAIAAIASSLTEWALAIGFWFRRLRIPMAIIGVGFHFVLRMVVRIGMLDWAVMFLYLSFLLPFNSSRSSASQASAKQ
jgi:hypothetical protein